MGQLLWKRVYEAGDENDGYRILIDGLWPRGLSKEKAKINYWAKTVAPSPGLRQLYHGGEIDYETFSKGYERELDSGRDFQDFKDRVYDLLKKGPVTLVYAGKLPDKSHISILRKKMDIF